MSSSRASTPRAIRLQQWSKRDCAARCLAARLSFALLFAALATCMAGLVAACSWLRLACFARCRLLGAAASVSRGSRAFDYLALLLQFCGSFQVEGRWWTLVSRVPVSNAAISVLPRGASHGRSEQVHEEEEEDEEVERAHGAFATPLYFWLFAVIEKLHAWAGYGSRCHRREGALSVGGHRRVDSCQYGRVSPPRG